DQVLGFDHGGIRRLYLDAKTSGRYDNVPTVYGKRLPAYAMTNAQEYFAELSEAYFGRNDFFPFRRKDLRGFDPGMFGLLNSLWQER
ncbi:MAG: metallopeptidase, partial [Alphaproteobacteria bacterium]|nr:metallopeptidase [Alphaproteobacteria bacterium]